MKGGDEIDIQCWLHDPTVKHWMKQRGFTTADQVLNFFMGRFYPLVRQHNWTAIGWDELIIDYDQTQLTIPKDVVIQVWRSREAFAKVVKSGYRALLSAGYV